MYISGDNKDDASVESWLKPEVVYPYLIYTWCLATAFIALRFSVREDLSISNIDEVIKAISIICGFINFPALSCFSAGLKANDIENVFADPAPFLLYSKLVNIIWLIFSTSPVGNVIVACELYVSITNESLTNPVSYWFLILNNNQGVYIPYWSKFLFNVAKESSKSLLLSFAYTSVLDIKVPPN